MRRPRFRIRTLLVLVTMTGIGAGGYVLWRRSVDYRRLASAAE